MFLNNEYHKEATSSKPIAKTQYGNHNIMLVFCILTSMDDVGIELPCRNSRKTFSDS